jgi:hypothetical protein
MSIFQLDPGASDFGDVVGEIRRRVELLPAPRSVVELGFVFDEIDWLTKWVRGPGVKRIVEILGKSGSSTEGASSEPSLAHAGLVLLVLAAEAGREMHESTRKAYVWKAVASMIPGELRKRLFTRKFQATADLKAMIKAAVSKFRLRNVLESGGQDWAETMWLQFGFCRSEAEDHLSDWLRGVRRPKPIRILLGDESDFTGLRSESFSRLWENLTGLANHTVSLDQARTSLRSSPWSKPGWTDALLKAASRGRTRVSVPASDHDRAQGDRHRELVSKAELYWPPESAPRFRLQLNKEEWYHRLISTTESQLVIEIDNVVVDRWSRSAGTYPLPPLLSCEPASSPPNLRPRRMIVRGRQATTSVIEIDLISLGLVDEIVLADRKSGELRPMDAELEGTHDHVVVCDDVLMVSPARGRQWKDAGRRAYEILAPLPSNLRAYFPDVPQTPWWTPKWAPARTAQRVRPVVRTEPPLARFGEDVLVIVEGLPADAINAKLDLGETPLPLRQEGVGTWTSIDRIRVEQLFIGNRIKVVHHRPGRRVALQPTAKVEAAAIGVIIRGRASVKRPDIITASACLDVGVGDDRRLEVLAGVSAPDDDPVILEGFRKLGTVRQARRFFTQKRLVAWGEEFRLEGAKLSERLAKSVIDRGLVDSVLAGPLVKGHACVSLKEKRKPSHDYAIWVSFEGSPLEQSLVQVTIDNVGEDSSVWRFEAVRPIQLLAITFRGERIGSWWDTKAMRKSLKSLERDASKAKPAFALLRWARVALLADEVRNVVQKLALKRPYDFLLAWIGKEGLQDGLSHSPAESAHGNVVIRQLLWSWQPSEDRQARMLFETISTVKSGRRHSGSFVEAFVEASDLCPPWLRQVYRFASESDSRDALCRVMRLSKESSWDELAKEASRRRRRMVREGIISESLVDSWIAEKALGREDVTRLQRFAENPEGRTILAASTLTTQIESGAFRRN